MRNDRSIEKILNNNVVIVKDDNNEDIIVMGRGLAFNKRVGDLIDEADIDKRFVLSEDVSSKFQDLVVDIPLEHIEIGEKIVSEARKQLKKDLNEMLYISLVDHIYTAIMRFQEGIKISNSLLWDIRRFYPDEFKVGLWSLDLIKEQFAIQLPDDEAGFIALHLVNASLENSDADIMYEIPKIIQEITNIVKYEFGIDLNVDSVYFYRFVTHLNFFAQRMVQNKSYEESDDGLLKVIKLKYSNSYSCSEKIAKFIQDKYKYRVSDEEKMYLTIHIERVVYKVD